MPDPRVWLIGGAPGAGKTTLGRALALRLDVASLSADDLFMAAKAVTTPETHPGLHVMTGSVEYFTRTPVEQLAVDTEAQHEAAWPAVERVVRNHATWGSPMVIDGWVLRPDRVAALGLDTVASVWLVADPAVLREREKANEDFFRSSPDPARMLENFLGRSLWFNALIDAQARAHGMRVLHQDGRVSVEELCAQVLAR